MKVSIQMASVFHEAHAFVDKRGEPVMIRCLDRKHVSRLQQMYLAFRPRNSFNGLPPIEDETCLKWVDDLVDRGVNLVAVSFEDGVVGHAALIPMDERTCEFLVVVSPGHQQFGIGTELTRNVTQIAYEAGVDRIWLCVESTNRVARHVYRKCGFEYAGDTDDTEVEMSCDIARYRRVLACPVSSVVRRKAVTLPSSATCEAAVRTCLERHLSALPIVDESGRVEGILTATDLLRASSPAQPVSDLLTRGVVTVREDCDIARTVRLLQARHLRCLPVVDADGRFVGVIGRREILAHYLRRVWNHAPSHALDDEPVSLIGCDCLADAGRSRAPRTCRHAPELALAAG